MKRDKRPLELIVIYEGDEPGTWLRSEQEISNTEKHLRSLDKLLWWWREAGKAVSIVVLYSNRKVYYEWAREPNGEYDTGRDLYIEPEW